jgi:hypothetical protein
MRIEAGRAVGPLSSTSTVAKAPGPSDRQSSGLGKAAGEWGWARQRSQTSKVVCAEKFHA